MPQVTVVMGGQYGSEGKGEFVAHLARTNKVLACVRTGGPNAGHTITKRHDPLATGTAYIGMAGAVDWRMKMRHIPCAWQTDGIPLYLSPGALIDQHVLAAEMSEVWRRGWQGHLGVDTHALVIDDFHREQETRLGMRARIGSTTEGIGAARADKIMRNAQLANSWRDGMWEVDFPGTDLCDVPDQLNSLIAVRNLQLDPDWDYPDELGVLIESTQGFGLSLELSGHYPFTTSTNITPGHLLGECGLSSRLTHQVIAVMRTFPIRVAGNSGPMAHEITWDKLHSFSDGRAPKDGEHTTVTNLVRRVGEWDEELADRMAMVCKPDYVALTFLDYMFPKLADCVDPDRIMGESGVQDYLRMVDEDCEAEVRWVSTGPGCITEIPRA